MYFTYCIPINENVSRHMRIASVEPLMEGVPLHDVDLLMAPASVLVDASTSQVEELLGELMAP